jgi:hypothetical protein
MRMTMLPVQLFRGTSPRRRNFGPAELNWTTSPQLHHPVTFTAIIKNIEQAITFIEYATKWVRFISSSSTQSFKQVTR